MSGKTGGQNQAIPIYSAVSWVAFRCFDDPGPNFEGVGIGIDYVDNPELFFARQDEHDEKRESAWQTLIASAQAGEIEACGLLGERGTSVKFSLEQSPIPKQFWSAAQIDRKKQWFSLGDRVYAGITFNRDQLLRAWPAHRAAPKGPVNRGVKPAKRQAVYSAILADLEKKKITETDLRSMKQQALAAQYGVGRELATKVRKSILAELETGKISIGIADAS